MTQFSTFRLHTRENLDQTIGSEIPFYLHFDSTGITVTREEIKSTTLNFSPLRNLRSFLKYYEIDLCNSNYRVLLT